MKRMLAMLLAMAMVVTMLPVPAFADDTDEEIEVTEAVEETTEAIQPEETEVPAEPETVPEVTEEAVPEETEAPAETEEPEETLPEETEEPDEVELEEPEEEQEEEIEDAAPASGVCGGNLTWALDEDGTLTISGTGDMWDYNLAYLDGEWGDDSCSDAPWGYFIRKVIIEEGVTSIGDYAFRGLISWGKYNWHAYSSLISATIPSSVTKIGKEAFAYCEDLVKIQFLGDCPVIEQDAFSHVKAIACYPVGNGTYANAGNFGGNITWVEDPGGTIIIAQGGCGDNLTWKLSEDGKLSISGTGAMYDFSEIYHTMPYYFEFTTPWYEYSSIICSIEVDKGVTTIGSYAFPEMKLDSVTLPDSLTSIGDSAFTRGSSVETLNISSIESWMKISFGDSESNPLSSSSGKAKVYIDGSLLEKLEIPSGTESVPSFAFYNWNLVTSVMLPNSLVSIGNSAFEKCSGLTSVTIGNSVTSIGSSAFSTCSNLSSVTIGNGVTSIGGSAFSSCSNLTSVTIGNNVTSIGDAAFHSCGSLTSITIPDRVTSIGKNTFYNCSGLTSVTIPDSVTSIGEYAFSGCSNIESLNISSIESWLKIAMKGETSNPLGDSTKQAEVYINGVHTENIEIPSNIATIASYVFYNWDGITSVSIPASVKTIDNYAFKDCDNLAYIRFLGDMPKAAAQAFSGIMVAAYYPAGNKTYTNNNLDHSKTNFGGVLMWLEYSGSTSEDDVIRQGTCGTNLTWSIAANRKLTISGTGAMTSAPGSDYYSIMDGQPWYEVQKYIKTVEIMEGATSIGSYVFSDCRSLTSVTIPNGVTSIGESAFWYCSNLKEIHFNGRRPNIESNAFYGVTATAYYPAKDSTYVGAGNYGGKITWVPYDIGILSGTCGDNLTWELDESGTLTISGAGAMQNYLNSNDFGDGKYFSPWYGYGEYIYAVIVENGVTTIGDHAFDAFEYYRSNLTSITLPNSLTSIGEWSICFSEKLTNIIIPDGVTSIGSGAFAGCRALKEIYFSGNMPSIGSNAFSGVTATAYYPAGNSTYKNAGQYGGNITWKPDSTDLGSGTCGTNLFWVLDESGKLTITGTGAMEDFADDATPWNDKLGQIKSVVIESGVTHLGDRAFQYADKLSSVSLPETLTSCGQYVFNGCISLTSVKVPDSLTTLGTGMFRSCSSLKTVTLPAGLKSMATWAFYGCTSLTSFTVPAGVTEIGRHTFRGCTNLTTVKLSDVTKLDQYAFAGCTSLKSIELPDTLISIETRAFQNCSSLKSIVLPNSVTAASDLAFSGCSSLTEVTLSESMTELKYQLFKDCSSLTSIVIPEKVATIGSQVFSGCSKLKTVTFQGDAPKIGGSCFSRTFTANYPCSGKGWSSAVFSNTGAAPTMVKYHPEKYYTESARVEPTCTDPGSYGEILCGSCGAKIKDATAIPAKGHSYEAVVTAPTCTEKGFTTYTCTVCGDSYVGDETELAPHTFEGAWFSSEEGHWHYCAVCNAQGAVEAHVPDRNAPTVDADQLCKLCGYVMQTRKPLIVIDAPRSLIVAGTSLKLSYHVVPEQDIKVVWKLGEGDEAYATLSQTGELTAKAVAEQHTITVYAEDAAGVCVAGKMSMSVCPVPTSITILEGSSFTVNVNEGGSLTLTAKCGPAGCAGNVIWKTSDTAGTYGSFRDNGNNTCTLSNLKLPGGKAASITLTASVYGTNVKSSAVVKLVSAPVPGSIQVTGPETLCGGAAGTYKASVNPDQPLTGSWVYALRSQDSAYASITAAGKLTTKAVPEAVDVVVSAYTRDYPDVVGTTVVHLVPGVQEITIQSPEAVVNDGVLSVNLTDSNTIRLEAAVLPTSAMQTGTWKTSSAAIATVNSSGQVTFQKTGTVTITFTANDGSKKAASVKICAGIPAMNLQISGDETLISGGKAALKATFSNIPTVKKLTWSSSDPTVATVTASGAVTAKTVYEEKTVTITAKATDGSGQTAEHVITVQPKANVLPVWDASGNVVTNQTLYLDTQNSVVSLTAPAGAKWTSSAPKVVEVVNGRLTLLKAGSAVITVKSADGKQTAKVTIKVSTLVRSLTIDTDCSVPLTSGKGKLTLKASVNVDATNKAVTWTSSNPSVASVTSTGAVTAKAGVLKDTEVTITATAKDGSGVTAQAVIKVIPASTAVHVVSVNALTCADGMQLRAGETLNGRTITLPVNQSFSLGAKVFPNALGAHADQTVTWKSSSAKIAQVDANGVVTALKAGTVTITVKTADGKTNTVKIKFV